MPVFIVDHCNYRKPSHFKYKRLRTEVNINALKNDLLKQNWRIVYEIEDTNKAYNGFLNVLKSLNDKNCLVKPYSDGQKQITSPWITKGLKNACKKRNTMYGKFIKEAENKYKKYKNKLNNIMRIFKKNTMISTNCLLI